MRALVGTGLTFVWDQEDAGQSLGRWCGKAHHASAAPLRVGVGKKVPPEVLNWKLALMQARVYISLPVGVRQS